MTMTSTAMSSVQPSEAGPHWSDVDAGSRWLATAASLLPDRPH